MVKTNRKKNISTIIILAIVLLVPGFLYIALNKIGSNEYLKLPIYGDKTLSGKMNRKMGREIPDTIFHAIKPIELIDKSGNNHIIFDKDSVISVVHLFYASDSGLSNVLMSNLKSVSARFSHNDNIKFYSISIDTMDKSQALTQVYNKYVDGVNANWEVLGSKTGFLDFVRDNFLIDAFQAPNDDNNFVFGNYYILLDSKNRIRGFYDMNLKTETARLTDEIKVQIVEELRNNPLKIEKR